MLRGRRSGLEPRGALPAAALLHLLHLRGRSRSGRNEGAGERNLFVLVRGMGETRELSSLCSLCSLTVEASGERQYLPARDLQQIRQAVEVRGLPREMCAVALFLLEISVARKNG